MRSYAKNADNLITEGAVKIYKSVINNSGRAEVFYNPVQIFNRDLSLLVIYTYAKQIAMEKGDAFKGLRLYDALTASGFFKKT